ncbi:MAG: transcriptional regulator, LysR family [Ramlibacter sp.]|nr:transcriptional regulator, LysR family [Ramlibacter sp.]
MSTIRFLRTVLAVAQEGSYSGAAQRVALTQAAVGLQMRALEAELKTQLFERSGRGVLLTAAGRALIARAEKMIDCYEQLHQGLEEESEIAGTVTVGSTVSAMGLLSNTVVAMKPRYPRLNVRLVVQESSGLAKSVVAGALDAAVMVEGTPLERQGLLWTPLYKEPLTVVASSLVAGPGSDIKKLLRENPFLRFDRRTPSGMRIEQTLRKLGLMPRDILELSSVSSIVDLVRQNVGVTMVPHWRNADWVNDPALCVLPLPGRPATRLIGMLQRSQREIITTAIRLQLIELLTRRTPSQTKSGGSAAKRA